LLLLVLKRDVRIFKDFFNFFLIKVGKFRHKCELSLYHEVLPFQVCLQFLLLLTEFLLELLLLLLEFFLQLLNLLVLLHYHGLIILEQILLLLLE